MEPLNRSLARGLDMLALLSEAPKGLALHEITRALDMPKSSAFNLIHTLLQKGYVAHDSQTGCYALSLRVFELGSAAFKGTNIETVLRQHMGDIYQASNETVHCGVPDGRDVVYIDKIESTHSIRMTSRIGARLPLYCTAMGRAILACMRDEEVACLLRDQVFEALTPKTLATREALYDELARVRAQGYAKEVEETNENVCCIGVAVRDRAGKPVYAISISAPIFRMDATMVDRYSQLLIQAQRDIERYLQMA